MQTTPNLGLKKPEGTDYVDIADLNSNMDKLDAEVVKLASPTDNGRMSAADKSKLNGIAAGANNYVHPSSHPASIITQDGNNRFVTDAEKTVWNAKETPAGAQAKADAAKAAANAYADTKTAGLTADSITNINLSPGQQIVSSAKNARMQNFKAQGKTVVGFDNRVGIIGVDGLYVRRYGRNMLPEPAQFTVNTGSASALNWFGPGSFELVTTVANGLIYAVADVVPNKNYTLSCDADPNINTAVYNATGTTALSPYASSPRTFNSGANTQVRLYFRNTAAGTSRYNNVQFEIGSTATPFQPREDSLLAFSGVELHANPDDGSEPDVLREVGGRYEVTRLWRKVILDGSFPWFIDPSGVATGVKRAYFRDGSVNAADFSGYATKYDGKSLTRKSTLSGPVPDQFILYKGNGDSTGVHLEISNKESGWGDSYTPTQDEIKAYFNGWFMYTQGQNPAAVSAGYMGTGVKLWTSIVNKDAANYVTTVPTIKSPGYNPHQLLYRLVTPVTESVQPDGSLSLLEGENFIEVGSGYVSREPAPQPVEEPGRINFGNIVFGSSPESIYAFKYAARKVLAVYCNGILDPRWISYNESITSNGDIAQLSAPNVFDPSLSYSVSYLKRTRSPVAIISGTLATTEKSQLTDLTDSVAEALAKLNGREMGKASPKQTTADITYYVRTDGNDSHTGMTNSAAGAFKTIGKAISMIPQVVNHSVTVNVAAGAYPEKVELSGFVGRGIIIIKGDTVASTSRSIDTIWIYRNEIQITLDGFNVTTATDNAVYVEGSANVLLLRLNIEGATSAYNGILCHSSKLYVNTCNISNKKAALRAHIQGEILSDYNSGLNNVDSTFALYGGKVSRVGTQPAGNHSVNYSGLNVNDVGVINPWGDNTVMQRSTMWAYRSTALGLAANTWSTVVMNIKDADNLGEFNTTTGVFVAKAWGWYLINVSMTLSATSPNTSAFLRVVKNGDVEYRLDSRFNTMTVNSDISVTGSVLINCLPGTSLIPQIYTTLNSNIAPGVAFTRFEVIRVS